MVMNVKAERLAVFDGIEQSVTFEGWEGLNEFEKLAAKAFEEGIENTLADNPPCMMIEPNEGSDDMLVQFWVQALGDGDNGPCWQFSMKKTFEGIDTDYSEEDQAEILKSLVAVTEYVRALVNRKVLA